MAQSKFGAAAGAGVVAAVLLLGGAAVPVAGADPGHSRDGSDSQRGGDSRGGGPDRTPGKDRSDVTHPRTSAGTGSTGGATTAPRTSISAQTSDGGGGSAAADTPPVVTAPTATVGNGRTPGDLTEPDAGPSLPAPRGPADTVEPVAPPPAVSPALPAPAQLGEARPWQRTVASLWATAAAPSRPGGVLFGLAGLLLAPLAGAWLGYRQARASKAAAQVIGR